MIAVAATALIISGCDLVAEAGLDSKKFNDAIQGCTESTFKAIDAQGGAKSRALVLSVISKCMESSSAATAGGKITCKPTGSEVRPGFYSDYTCEITSKSGTKQSAPLGSSLDTYISEHPGLPTLGP